MFKKANLRRQYKVPGFFGGINSFRSPKINPWLQKIGTLTHLFFRKAVFEIS